MKKEIEYLIATDGAALQLNSIFSLRRDLGRDEITGRDIDNIFLRCDLPGSPAAWSERIAARQYADLITEVDAAMRRMMAEATEQLSSRLRAGKL